MGVCQCAETRGQDENKKVYEANLITKQNYNKFESIYQSKNKPIYINHSTQGPDKIKIQKVQFSEGDRVAKYVPVNLFGSKKSFIEVISMTPEIDHPNVLKFYEFFIEEDWIIMIYEYCQGESLDCFLKRINKRLNIPETQIQSIASQLLALCSQLEENDYQLQSLNPSQIMLKFRNNKKLNNSMFLRIPILSIEKSIIQEKEKRFFNLQYASPEQIFNNPLSNKADVYSVGLILAELMLRQYPFTDCTQKQHFVMLYETGFSFNDQIGKHLEKYYSEKMISTIENMLQIDPAKRSTAKEAQQQNLSLKYQNTQLSTVEAKNLVLAIHHFNKMDDFKQIVFNYMCINYTQPQKRNYWEVVFNKIDVDLSGTINMQEFEDVLKFRCKDVKGYENSQVERVVQIFFKNADKSGDGTLSFSGNLSCRISNSSDVQRNAVR